MIKKILSPGTIALHMHPKDGAHARMRVLRSCTREQLTQALELASSCSLTFPGYGHRRTVVLIRRALEKMK